MIPYLELPIVRIADQPIHPFTWLVGLGMILTYFLAQRRVKQVGLYPPFSAAALVWITIGAFLGAHVFEVLAYYPERFLANPMSIFAIWEGMSSFGGFIGGTLALYCFCQRHGIWMLPYLDAMMFGFAPGWILARGGCYTAHDHPGWMSDFFLAVAYPGGARHDLGFYEMLLAVVISLVLYLLPRRARFVGFYTALVLAIYGPGRFLLDILRTGDRRYLGLTPAQYLCVAMVGISLYLFSRKRTSPIDIEDTAWQDAPDTPDAGHQG